MKVQAMAKRRDIRRPRPRGFTLAELLIVMLIVLLVSAVALPTVIPAITHRQVTEAASLLQASLMNARDTARSAAAPRGLRLLPDPVYFNRTSANGAPAIARLANGEIDPTAILASNRFIPIETAPDYSEGRVDVYRFNTAQDLTHFTPITIWHDAPPYPGPPAQGTFTPTDMAAYYPLLYSQAQVPYYPTRVLSTNGVLSTINALAVVQRSFYVNTTNANALMPNSPTSWYWNIRVGDRIQLGDTGMYYTVVGPMTVKPVDGNTELFVNDGLATQPPHLERTYYNGVTTATARDEYLILVNNSDDDGNGFTDDGWDGIDNNGNGLVDELDEWENEKWLGSLGGLSSNTTNLPYSIRRRPVPASGAKEVAFPSNVVIDLTSWGASGVYAPERSRLPVNRWTGYVDVLINSTGEVSWNSFYSSPSFAGLGNTFLHFWLAERVDVVAPVTQTNVPYLLPMPVGTPNYPNVNDTLGTRLLTGERKLVSLNARTGVINVNEIETFNGINTNAPYAAAQQGLQGGP